MPKNIEITHCIFRHIYRLSGFPRHQDRPEINPDTLMHYAASPTSPRRGRGYGNFEKVWSAAKACGNVKNGRCQRQVEPLHLIRYNERR